MMGGGLKGTGKEYEIEERRTYRYEILYNKGRNCLLNF
jgi:hypothetical protein